MFGTEDVYNDLGLGLGTAKKKIIWSVVIFWEREIGRGEEEVEKKKGWMCMGRERERANDAVTCGAIARNILCEMHSSIV